MASEPCKDAASLLLRFTPKGGNGAVWCLREVVIVSLPMRMLDISRAWGVRQRRAIGCWVTIPPPRQLFPIVVDWHLELTDRPSLFFILETSPTRCSFERQGKTSGDGNNKGGRRSSSGLTRRAWLFITKKQVDWPLLSVVELYTRFYERYPCMKEQREGCGPGKQRGPGKGGFMT
jgi:hypothetical protein